MKYQLTKKVLITQAGTRNGYVITYSLGKEGIQVHCADSNKICMSRFSRYCCSFHAYPNPHKDPDGYFDTLNQLVEKLNISYIFPAYDEAILLSMFKDKLTKTDILIIPSYENMYTLHNKPTLYDLCNKIGCDVPRISYIKTLSDIDKAIEKLSFPLVLKPERGGGGWGVTFIKNYNAFYSVWCAFDQELHKNRLIAQEFIPGKLYGHGVLCNRGNILASNTYQTCRQYPIGRGTPSYRRGIEIQKISEQAGLILKYLKWTGVCQMDFIVDRRNDRAVLIDANPRFWGSTAHGIASGINFPFLLYVLASGQHDNQEIKGKVNGITSTWAWGDFIVMIIRLLKESDKGNILKDHLHSWRNTYFDELKIEDPIPFFVYPIQKYFSILKRKNDEGF